MSSHAPFGSLICDDYGARCDCCDRFVRRTRSSFWHGPHRVCFACFAVWYDDVWETSDDIKQKVLAAERAGTFPFNMTDTGAERVPE